MKISRKEALAFFAAIGFSKATTWKADKLKEKLAMVPDKVKQEDVPAGFEDFYKGLAEAGGDVELVVEEGEEELATAKPAKAKKAKPAAKPAKAKKDKPAKAKKDKPAKPLAASKIGSAVSDDWKNDYEVAKDAGITLKQARSRLRHAVHRGLMESRRLSQYRLIKPLAKNGGE